MTKSVTWVKSFENGLDYVEDLDGVPWSQAPMPWRWHRCKPQTRGRFRNLNIDRCACGSCREVGSSVWIERNSRDRGGHAS